MDVLLLIVFGFFALAFLGGLLSLQHAIIKPVVNWLNPAPSRHEPPPDDLQERAMKAQRRPAPPPEPRGTPDGMYTVRKLLEEQARVSRPKPRKTPSVQLMKLMKKASRQRHIRQAMAAHELARRSNPSARPRLP